MVYFTIVIPTYNREKLIVKTLESILSQTFMDYEVLIIDDGSTDNTEETIQIFLSDKVRYYKKDNEERAVARNFGAKLANGKYINWFDSDDIMLPNHLQEAFDFIQIHKEFVNVFHLSYRKENQNNEILYAQHITFKTINHLLYKGNILSCNGVFVKKETALLNPYNENRLLSASEDYELWIRLAAQFPFYHINKHTSVIIQHDERSVLTFRQTERLEKRFLLLMTLVKTNPIVLNFLKRKANYFLMKNYLLLAVDIASTGNRTKTLKYFLKAIGYNWRFITERSFYATIKHLILGK
jgi:glycosyltransferase involved in cell wall biosynthesis